MSPILNPSRNRPPSLRFDQLELSMSMLDVLPRSATGPYRGPKDFSTD